MHLAVFSNFMDVKYSYMLQRLYLGWILYISEIATDDVVSLSDILFDVMKHAYNVVLVAALTNFMIFWIVTEWTCYIQWCFLDFMSVKLWYKRCSFNEFHIFKVSLYSWDSLIHDFFNFNFHVWDFILNSKITLSI